MIILKDLIFGIQNLTSLCMILNVQLHKVKLMINSPNKDTIGLSGIFIQLKLLFIVS